MRINIEIDEVRNVCVHYFSSQPTSGVKTENFDYYYNNDSNIWRMVNIFYKTNKEINFTYDYTSALSFLIN
jgi:hypothetical protein